MVTSHTASFVHALKIYTGLYLVFLVFHLFSVAVTVHGAYFKGNDKAKNALILVVPATLCFTLIAPLMGILYSIPATRRSPHTRILSFFVVVLFFLIILFWTAAAVVSDDTINDSSPHIVMKGLSMFLFMIAQPLLVFIACIHYLVVYKRLRLPS